MISHAGQKRPRASRGLAGARSRTSTRRTAPIPAVASAAHGDPNICYFHGYWELEPGEALLVEVTPPVCDYWNFQVDNYWMESLDYRYHTIDVNHHGARYEDDGSVKLVVAEHDPGFGNWLETAGHRRGTMCLRWIRADDHPKPEARVITP